MTIAEKIKAAREQAGMTQQELADKLCVSRSAVAKWETGKGLPDIDNLKAISKLFGMPLDDLMDDDKGTVQCVLREPIPEGMEPHEAVFARWPEAVRIDRMFLMHDFGLLGRVLNALTFGWLGSAWRLIHYAESYRDLYYLVDVFDEHLFVRAHEGQLCISPLSKRILRSERDNSFCHQGRTYMGGGKMKRPG